MLYNDVVQHFFSKCKVNKFFFMTKCFAVKNIHSLPTSRHRIHLQYDMGGVPISARRPYRVVEIYYLRRHSLGIRTTAISTMLPVLLSRIIMTNGWLNISPLGAPPISLDVTEATLVPSSYNDRNVACCIPIGLLRPKPSNFLFLRSIPLLQMYLSILPDDSIVILGKYTFTDSCSPRSKAFDTSICFNDGKISLVVFLMPFPLRGRAKIAE